MSNYQEMEQVRNYVAKLFGENKVTKLAYYKQVQRYHNEHYYYFTVNNKIPLEIRLITGYEPHYKFAIYELVVSQTKNDKLKSNTIKLTKQMINAANIIDLLHSKFKMPIN